MDHSSSPNRHAAAGAAPRGRRGRRRPLRRPPPPSYSPWNAARGAALALVVARLLVVAEMATAVPGLAFAPAAPPSAFALAPRGRPGGPGIGRLPAGGVALGGSKRRIVATSPPRSSSRVRGAGTAAASTASGPLFGARAGGDDGAGVTTEKTSVAIVGSGAVGSYYGSRLWEARTATGDVEDGERIYDVRFLARGAHYEACVSDGLHVSSIDGDVTIPPSDIRVYESPHKIGPVDWVVVALKSTSLADAPSLVGPLLKKDGTTRVVAVMNGLIDGDLVDMLRGLGTPKQVGARQPELVNAAAGSSQSTSSSSAEAEDPARTTGTPPRPPLPCAAVYGGMALLCSNRVAPGRISHTYAGLLTCGVAATSRSTDEPSMLSEDDADLEAVREFFDPTAIELNTETSLVRGRWLKNCWNLPYNGVSVAMGGVTVDAICGDRGLRALADKIMDETIDVANADLRSRGVVRPSDMLDREAVKKKMWSFTDVMGPYKTSTMLDLLARKPMEVRYLFGKPLERARELNVSVPHFETVVLQIEAMQRFHDLF